MAKLQLIKEVKKTDQYVRANQQTYKKYVAEIKEIKLFTKKAFNDF